jgi:hypothetical protein
MNEATIRKAFEEMEIGKEIFCPQAFAISEKYHIPRKISAITATPMA